MYGNLPSQVYHDMHDGDYKTVHVNVSAATLTITPVPPPVFGPYDA